MNQAKDKANQLLAETKMKDVRNQADSADVAYYAGAQADSPYSRVPEPVREYGLMMALLTFWRNPNRSLASKLNWTLVLLLGLSLLAWIFKLIT